MSFVWIISDRAGTPLAVYPQDRGEQAMKAAEQDDDAYRVFRHPVGRKGWGKKTLAQLLGG